MNRSHPLLYALLLCLALPAAPAHAAAPPDTSALLALCETMTADQTLSVRTNTMMVRYRYDQSVEEMTNIVLAHQPIRHKVAGLTLYHSDYTLRLVPTFSSATINGRYCYRIRAELDLAKLPITVSIAKEHSHNKCMHDVLMEHEMKHVAVYQSYMRYFAQEFERMFAPMFKQVRLTPHTAGVEEEINRVLAPAVKHYIDTSLQRIASINTEVDSPEEYARIGRACPIR